jgi:diguanylate cyclase (GGDEF)-like protein/PAS domain S-box-containing protein
MEVDQLNVTNQLLYYLTQEQDLLQLTIDALPVPIFYKDTAGVYLRCNKAFEDFIQISRHKLVGNNAYQLFDADLAHVYHQADIDLIEAGGVQIYEKQITNYQGDEAYVKFNKTVIKNEDGDVTGLVGVIFDITEQKRLEAQLLYKVEFDDLTGLFNRYKGYQIADNQIESANESGVYFGVLMIDIDNFKCINDTWGHLVGDKALRHIANAFKQQQTESESIIRWGGEEFLILVSARAISASQFADSLAVIAERYRNNIANNPLIMEKGTIAMTISIGGSYYNGQTLKKMISESDKRLYAAKSLGKNQVCIS